MDPGTFGAHVAEMKQRIRRRHVRAVAVPAVAAAAGVMSIPYLVDLGVDVAPHYLAVGGLFVVSIIAAVLLKQRPRGLAALSRAVSSADVPGAFADANGAVTFTCTEGLFLGPQLRVVQFDDDFVRIEGIAYLDAKHSMLVQIWQLRRDRNGNEHEVITPVHIPLQRSMSPDEALKRAVAWSKLAWHVRHRGGPAPASA